MAEILADVRDRGDAALRDWTFRIDGVNLDRLVVDRAEIAAAADRLPAELIESLRFAADRIRRFHSYQPLPSWTTNEMGGTLDSWDGIFPALSKRFRTLRYDQRGSGLSEKVRQPITTEILEEDLEAVLAL